MFARRRTLENARAQRRQLEQQLQQQQQLQQGWRMEQDQQEVVWLFCGRKICDFLVVMMQKNMIKNCENKTLSQEIFPSP